MGASHESDIEEEIGDYLDQVVSQLLGIIPYRERQALREDVEEHLRSLIDEHIAEGVSPPNAIKMALGDFGSATELAQEYLSKSSFSYPISNREQRVRSGVTRAYLVFALPAIVFVLFHQLIQLYGDPYQLYPWLIVAGCVAPVLAGFFSGWTIRDRFFQSVFRALSIVLVFAVLAAAAAWPIAPSPVVPLLIGLVWFPAGLIASLGGAYWRQRRRAREDAMGT